MEEYIVIDENELIQHILEEVPGVTYKKVAQILEAELEYLAEHGVAQREE